MPADRAGGEGALGGVKGSQGRRWVNRVNCTDFSLIIINIKIYVYSNKSLEVCFKIIISNKPSSQEKLK